MLDKAKLSLRVSNVAFDDEIIDLIEAARLELIEAGVSGDKAMDDSDPLIKRAIITYVKANFGFDNPDYEKLNESFKSLKIHLSQSSDYHAIS